MASVRVSSKPVLTTAVEDRDQSYDLNRIMSELPQEVPSLPSLPLSPSGARPESRSLGVRPSLLSLAQSARSTTMGSIIG